MENLITVISLQGQAWAVAQDGTRRELKVGDTVAADEMVITADGAQIDLQFANNNQVLTLIGEHEIEPSAQTLPEPSPLSQPLTPVGATDDTPPSSAPRSRSSDIEEGHGFVQLVRIAEIIESDGFTPLTVARVQEIIKPLGMVLPERDFEQDRWKENVSYPQHSDGGITGPINLPPSPLGTLSPQNNLDAEEDIKLTLDLDQLFNDPEGDPLTYTVSNLPPGLNFDPKTGEITGTIDRSASQGGNNGKYKVIITATDPSGNTGEQIFTWTVTNPAPEAQNDAGETLKSTRLIKDADNGVLKNDSDPDGDPLFVQDVTHGGETVIKNAKGELVIEGKHGTLVLQPDGSYVYTPDLSDKDGPVWKLEEDKTLTDTFKYTVSDGEGGTAEADLVITIKGHSNTPPFLIPEDHNNVGNTAVAGHVTVHEKGLAAGTEPGQGHTAEGVINVHAMDGLQEITITDKDGTEHTYPLAELNAVSNSPKTIEVKGGTLTLTGFEPEIAEFDTGDTQVVGGKIKYTYELTAVQDHATGDGNSLTLEIPLDVKDDQGADSSLADHKLVVNVIDDVPVAVEDTNEIDEDTVSVDGNVLTNDKKGADGANVTGVQAGTVDADTHVTDGNLDTDITGEFGSLKLNADGTYTYTLNNSNLEVQGLIEGEKLSDTFTYTITDDDGDKSTTTLSITINGQNDEVTLEIPEPPVTDTVVDPTDPTKPNNTVGLSDQVVFESGLSDGSKPDTDATKVNSSFTIEALDGLDPNTAVTITYKDVNGDKQTLEISKENLEGLIPSANQTITTQYGELVLNGYSQDTDGKITISYEYTLINAPEVSGESTTDDFTITATDRQGATAGTKDSDSQTLSIKIIDDAPTAEDDANEVTATDGDDDSASTATGNVIGGANASANDEKDTTGADGATVTAVKHDTEQGTADGSGNLVIEGAYGTLTIQPDGSYSYVLDNNNPAVQKLHPDDADLEETFNYTITDGDGDTANANLVITIKGNDDGVTVTVPDPTDSNDPNYPVEDPNNSSNPTWGNINDHVVFESGLVGGSQNGDNPEADGSLVKVKSSFTLSALDGLNDATAITFAVDGKTDITLTKGNVEALSDSNTQTITTEHGELELNGYTHNADGTITIDYEYTLTSAPENTAAGDGSDADKFTDDSIKIIVTDRAGSLDPDTATENLVIRIMDDVPAVSATGTLPADLVIDESTMDISAEGSFASAFGHHFGADGEATAESFVYNFEIDSTVNLNLKDTATGQSIKLELDGETVKGVVNGGAADGQTVFTVTVDSEGKVTLKQERAMEHSEKGKVGADDVLSLPADSIKLTATVTDKDGDSDSASIDIGNKFTFHDDGPTLDATSGNLANGTFTDNAIVDEKYLPSGSDSNEAALKVSKVLPIDFGADGAMNFDEPQNPTTGLTFKQSNLAALKDLGLKSGTTDLTYALSDDGHTITATRGEGGNEIFTITLSVDGDGTPSYEFTLQGPLDHSLQKDSESGKYSADNIVLPFDITATDGDGDTVDLKFKVEVVDDTPETADLTQTVDEDGSISFSNADINTTTTKVNDNAQPEHGEVTIGDDGTVTYTPHEDYRGEDSYTYTVTTGGVSYERKVDVTVKPVSDKPLFANGDGKYPDDIAGVEIGKDGSVPQDTYDYSVQTNEDVAVGLGLHVPKVKDDGEHDDNNDTSELLGAIILEFKGLAPDYTPELQDADGNKLSPDTNGKFQFVIVDNETDKNPLDWHLKEGLPTEGNGVYYLTEEQYKVLQVDPPAERHENFKVEVSVESFEVDGDGKQLDGVAGAKSTQVIDVNVQAVTDPVDLKIKGADSNYIDGDLSNPIAVPMDEDEPFDLATLLQITLDKASDGNTTADVDGSEERWFTVTGLPVGSDVNGHTITAAESTGGYRVDIPNNYNDTNPSMPEINVTAPKDFSGDIEGVEIKLHAQDRDDDGVGEEPTTGAELTDSVYVDLHVNPIAGDVGLAADDVTTPEDTAVNFLRNIKVTDDGSDGGEEIITKVAFELPENWKLTKQPDAGAAGDAVWTVSGDGSTGSPYTVSFSAGTEANREAALKQFEVTPPAHSSKDETIKVTVTTEDTNTVGGNPETSPTVDTVLDIKVEVTPVAEKIAGEYVDGKWVPAANGEISDTDGDDNPDLTMTTGHSYKTAGEEDEWFELGVEGDFELKANWTNQDGKDAANGNTGTDGSEETFALLTPELIAGDDSQANANGAKFEWIENGKTKSATFGGDPIEVPLGSLDSLKFKAPENFAGMFKIKVQAKTVDQGDDPSDSAVEAISGEAWLENVLIAPKADTSTTSLTARVEGNEDEAMPLSIRPKSSDPAEIFDVSVGAVPDGAMLTFGDSEITYVITKDGVFKKEDGLDDDGRIKPGTEIIGQDLIDLGISVEMDGADKWKVSFEGFDSSKDMTVTAPLDSNKDFELTVSTQTVDVLEIPAGTDLDGITMPAGVDVVGNATDGYTLTSKSNPPEELTIDVAPKGVADPAIVELDGDATFTEEDAESAGIKLNDLFTNLELKDADGSETLSFKIGDLPAGFTVEGATYMGEGTWSFGTAEYDAEAIKIHPPQNYNGKFKFDFYTITTEDDGDSLTEDRKIEVTVTPSPEAGMNLASNGNEDESFQLDFGVKHKNGDDDEFVSKVFIKVDSVTDGLTLTLGENGSALSTKKTIGGSEYYVVEQGSLNNIFAQGATNWAGEVSFDVRYEITDPGNDGLDNVSKTTETDETYTVTVNPVTDQVTLEVTVGADTTLTEAGTVNVKLKVGNEGQDGGDYDGSEALTRIIVENVPDGVVITSPNSHFIGGGQWVIVKDETMSGELFPELDFQVHSSAGGLTGHEITVTVVSEDAGNGQETTASKTITISTDFTKGEPEQPAEIIDWEQTDYKPTEDTHFTLKEAIKAEIETGVTDNGFTITLTDLPEGTVVVGMQKTTIGGKEVWSATGSGGDDELQTLLGQIKVTPPLDWNNNNHPDGFKYNAKLTTHVPSGGRAEKDIDMIQVVTPVTDDADIAITANTVGEGSDLLISIDALCVNLSMNQLILR